LKPPRSTSSSARAGWKRIARWTSTSPRSIGTAIPAISRITARERAAGAAAGGEGPGIDERGDFDETLAQHLHAQIGAATSDAQLLFVARWLIDQIDEAGYLTITLAEAAADLGVPPPRRKRRWRWCNRSIPRASARDRWPNAWRCRRARPIATIPAWRG
jgi:DNA-directed RNA polymerase specialized sigma54-like protein